MDTLAAEEGPQFTLRSEPIRFVLDAVAGTIGSIAGILCGHPFDVVKVSHPLCMVL